MDEHDRLNDKPAPGRRFEHAVNFKMDADQYRILIDLVHHKALTYGGKLSAALRDAIDDFIDRKQAFLSLDKRAFLSHLRQLQDQVTFERYIFTTDELLDTQVTTLRHLTTQRDWMLIVESLEGWRDRMVEMPPNWRRVVADRWNRAAGLRDLVGVWAAEMEQDAPALWLRVQETLEQIGGPE